MAGQDTQGRELIQELTNLYAVRYVTIAGVVVVLYDSFLSLATELDLVWAPIFRRKESKNAFTLSKFMYLFSRFAIMGIALQFLSDIIPSQELSNTWYSFRHRYHEVNKILIQLTFRCQNAITIVLSIDVLVEGISCGTVLHRLFVLWEFEPRTSWLMLFMFFVCKSICTAFAAIIIVKNRTRIAFFSFAHGHVRFCAIPDDSILFLGVWIPCVVFDVFAFGMLIFNALSRPRHESQRLLRMLYSDGVVFFLTTFSMRLLNLILAAAAPPSLAFLGVVFSASMVTVAVSRSFLRLHSATYTRPDTFDPTLISEVQWRRTSKSSSDTISDSDCSHHYYNDWGIGKDLPRL